MLRLRPATTGNDCHNLEVGKVKRGMSRGKTVRFGIYLGFWCRVVMTSVPTLAILHAPDSIIFMRPEKANNHLFNSQLTTCSTPLPPNSSQWTIHVLPHFPSNRPSNICSHYPTAKEISRVIHLLTQSPPSLQRATIERYFTPNAAFTHPICRTGSFEGSRWLIWCIYRWYKIMSPRIELEVDSVGTLHPLLVMPFSIHSRL